MELRLVGLGWLVWSALARRPLRSILTTLAIAVAFLLLGLLKGFTLAVNKVAEDTPAARLEVQRRSHSLGAQGLPLAYVQALREMRGVRNATYLDGFPGFYQNNPMPFQLLAVDEASVFSVIEEFVVSNEHRVAFRQSRAAVLVGDSLIKSQGWKVGDRIPLRVPDAMRRDGSDVWTFQVAGTWRQAVDQPTDAIFIHYEYVNDERFNQQNQVAQISVLVSDPMNPADMARKIDEHFINSSVPTRTQTSREGILMNLQQGADVEFFADVVVGSSIFSILFVVAGTLAQSFRERQTEFAVLQALGFHRGRIVELMVAESFALCGIGAVVGITGAQVVAHWALSQFAPITSSLCAMLYVYATLVALTLALLAVVLPAFRAHRLSVIDALANRSASNARRRQAA